MACPACGFAADAHSGCCPSCGADLTLAAPGTLVAGRYEVRALLGRGGMGAVYRAFDRVLQEEVALKLQRADAAGDPAAERRFRSEVRLARQITHPNVCRLHDGGLEGARRWISMELVQGTTLAARLREGRLEEREAWALAIQAADGLAAVHRAGVVHRDLKSLNLMVDGQGRLRLMDFGIAKPAAEGDTASGYALGSPAYMSPEQARGRATDARSDVYSLGVVLFEIFTGELPFRADSPVAMLLQHIEASPAVARMPEALWPVIGRALAKDPGARHPDGGALADALRSAREGPPPDAVPARRPPWRRVGVGLAVGVTGALAWAALWREGRLPSTSPVSQTSLAGETSRMRPAPAATASRVPTFSVASPARAAANRTTTPSRMPAAAVPVPSTAPGTPAPATPTATPDATMAAAAPVDATALRTATLPESHGPPATPQPDGTLLVVVRPWADVTIDGIPQGQTPLGRLFLAPGPHNVVLEHPDYQPYRRKITLRSGETIHLTVNLPADAVRRRRQDRSDRAPFRPQSGLSFAAWSAGPRGWLSRYSSSFFAPLS